MTEEKQKEERLRDKQDFSDLRKSLRGAWPPVSPADPPRDLWPAMSRRLQQPPAGSLSLGRWPAQIPWFDWALLGIAAVTLLFFPALIPALLYHF